MQNTILRPKTWTIFKINTAKLLPNSSGKVLKFENWGLISFANKIKTFNKGYYLHIKFQSNSDVIKEIKNKVKLDKNIIRDLVVKYKKLDLKKEYFGKKQMKKRKNKFNKRGQNPLTKLSLFQKK